MRVLCHKALVSVFVCVCVLLLFYYYKKMMFNGLLICGDSDASDYTKQGSVGACSADGSLAPPDVESLQSKLLATMQILENKEETIRVQAQSLALAEERIAELTKSKSTCPPSPKMSRGVDPCLVEKADLSTNTNLYQEGRRHDKIVATLQDNLSVIEELYKECFYETAKQDELISSLRDSFAEVRLMEKEKTDQIGRMQIALNAQKWSLDRRQDIAMEVESLKSDISNYLYNSNYDSGVWEREEAAGSRGERGQRREGADLRTNECTCGLKEENAALRHASKHLEVQVAELSQRVQHLELTLQEKCRENVQCQQRLEQKEKEFQCMSQRLGVVEKSSRDQTVACDSLTQQLEQLQALLAEKGAQLMQVQQQCDVRESTVLELQRRLDDAQRLVQREHEACEEALHAAQGAGEWRRRCRERTSSMSRLRAQLLEAQSRGARLCAETQALLASLRSCLHRYKIRMREQQERIREQDEIIRSLRQGPNRRSASTCYDEPSCSKYLQCEGARRDDGASEISDCTKWRPGQKLQRKKTNASRSFVGCSKCIHFAGKRQRDGERSSGSETNSHCPPPKPPRRMKKTQFFDDCASQSSWRSRDASVQRPERCDATTGAAGGGRQSRCSRCSPPTGVHCHELCNAEQLLERVSATRDALLSSHRRWSRHAHSHDSTHTIPHHDNS